MKFEISNHDSIAGAQISCSPNDQYERHVPSPVDVQLNSTMIGITFFFVQFQLHCARFKIMKNTIGLRFSNGFWLVIRSKK
jgi:hypothetical protein